MSKFSLPNRILNAWEFAKKGFSFPGYDGMNSSFRNDFHLRLPGTSLDYEKLVGDMWQNSAVQACLNWLVVSLPDAKPCVFETVDNKPVRVDTHPLNELLQNPNQYYDGSVLWSGTLLSFVTNGNAYWRFLRGSFGEIKEIWYIPHHQMFPRWSRDGSDFISHYEYRVDGKIEMVLIEDVLHFRYGINPYNIRMGMSPLQSVIREIYTDTEATNYSATILKNMGITSLIASPKQSEMTTQTSFDPQEFVRAFSKKKGDGRGEALALDVPLDITTIDNSPEKMALDVIRKYPESRICAVIGIPAMVVGLQAGLERSTFSNYEEARKVAWNDSLIPIMRMFGSQCTRQLLQRMEIKEKNRYYVDFDTSNISVLQPDVNAIHLRAREDFKAGVITRDEARSFLGLETIDNSNVFASDKIKVEKESVENEKVP